MSQTTIAVSNETKDLLKSLGSKGDTYDDVIRELYNAFISEHYRILEKEKFTRLK